MKPQPLETHREIVRPEWTDYNGHMNVAYYTLIFDHATDAFWDFADFGVDYRNRTNCSTFTVEAHITYDAELVEGAEAYCTTQLLSFDEKRIHYFHRMYHGEDDTLAATTELLSLHIDLGVRRVTPMPDPVQARFAEILKAHAAIERPDKAGRVISIAPRGGG